MKTEKELAKEYIKLGFNNSRNDLKRMEAIEKQVEKNGYWNKFSKATVDNLINELLRP
jgi:hypothetical protein